MGKSWHKLWWSWLPEGVIPSIHKDKSWNSENDRDILLIYNSLSSTTVCKWQFGIGLALSVNSSIQLFILVTCRYCIDICRYYSSHYIPMSFPLNQHEFIPLYHQWAMDPQSISRAAREGRQRSREISTRGKRSWRSLIPVMTNGRTFRRWEHDGALWGNRDLHDVSPALQCMIYWQCI